MSFNIAIYLFKLSVYFIYTWCIVTNINSDTKWHSSYGFSYCLASKTFFYGNLFILISNRGSQVCLTFENKCWKHYTHYNQFINQFGAILCSNWLDSYNISSLSISSYPILELHLIKLSCWSYGKIDELCSQRKFLPWGTWNNKAITN